MNRFSLDVVRRKISRPPLTLRLPVLPPSASNLYINVPGKGRVKSVAYENWLGRCALLLKAQGATRICSRVDIVLRLEDTHPGRDASNCIKPVEELLVATGVLADDRARFVRSVKAEWGPANGVEITLVRAP